ncbi:RNA polymerase sigma-70 factor (ECF subfamily) [Hoyosella altamirensis]|uniref:RNA polymerase sigma-70 factor (ECF subfamily) n=2 Tax=Hoyosella altamirensis TaxID=616997 RepID=A0A839RS26_9ACTN|nr:RNA polymerase sigma-70 factor (ECF subfamily) [Hoyosella altamirensis]
MSEAHDLASEDGAKEAAPAPVTPSPHLAMKLSDEDLSLAVAAAGRGDRVALSTVLEAIRPAVVRYCRARVGIGERGHVSADDVAQEVCMAVMTALPRYQDQGRPFMSFVYGIAAHKVADAHRSSARNRQDPTEDMPDFASGDDGPEDHALLSESSRRVQELLNSLSPEQREILILRVIEGVSAQEAAEIVGSTAGAVRVAQHRALAKLKKAMGRVGDIDG